MLDYIITQKGTFLTFSSKCGVVFAIISKDNDFLKLKPGFVMVLPIYFATIWTHLAATRSSKNVLRRITGKKKIFLKTKYTNKAHIAV